MAKKIKTSLVQKTILIILGVVFTLFILEMFLRFAGVIVSFNQDIGNLKLNDGKGYRILALGESTTANVYIGQSAWPEELEKKLNMESKTMKYRVFNAGISGTNTAYILARLKNNLELYKPNMVITMMGINDDKLRFKYEENTKVRIRLFLHDIKIYKLGFLLFEAFQNKFLKIENINLDGKKFAISNNVLMGVPNSTSNFNQINLLDMEKNCQELLKNIKDNALQSLVCGDFYFASGKLQKAEEIYNNSLKLAHLDPRPYLKLGELYYFQGRFSDAEIILKKALNLPSIEEITLNIYTLLAKIYYQQGKQKEVDILFNTEGLSLKLVNDSTNEITKFHYQQIYKILKERKIKLVVMQYPTQDIKDLKNIFTGEEDIIFVSNEENFKAAMKNATYSDFFIDRIGKTFGHATLKGNVLIAENVANHILKELNLSEDN